MQGNFTRELEMAAAKTSPAVGMVAASFAGLSVEEWMYAGTLLYVLLQSGYLAWKWVRERRRGNRRRK